MSHRWLNGSANTQPRHQTRSRLGANHATGTSRFPANPSLAGTPARQTHVITAPNATQIAPRIAPFRALAPLKTKVASRYPGAMIIAATMAMSVTGWDE